MSSKNCPKCGLLNHETSTRCDCGYDFPSGEMKESYLSQAPAASAVNSPKPSQNLARLILGKSVVRLFRGLAGAWILIIFILPYSLMSSGIGVILSILLFILVYGLVLWDFKKETRRIYPFVLDGFILFCIAGLSGAIFGVLRGLFNYEWKSPSWLYFLTGLLGFVLLEIHSVCSASESSPPTKNASRRQSRGSYFASHWYGELSLPLSYWVNGLVISVVPLALIGLAPWDRFINRAPKTYSTVIVVLWVVQATITVWQLTGIWRSADHYLDEGKSKFWGNAAKVAVILGIIIGIRNYVSVGIPQITEYTKIAIGKDPLGSYQIRVLRDATELEVSGAIIFGLTDDVHRVLSAHPTVKILHLNSHGGRVGEARKLRDLIDSRGPTTYTASGCLSACTLAYVAGGERLIAKKAALGFHQYSFPGRKQSDFKASYEVDKQDWLVRGFTKDFIDRAFSTPNNEMWKPSHQILFEAGIITKYAGEDDVAITNLPLDNFAKVEAAFLKTPLFAALKTYEPKTYDRWIYELRTGLQKGRSIAELRQKFIPLAESVYTQRLPYASNSSLRKFVELLLDQMKVLYKSDPALCYEHLNPEEGNSTLNINQYFPKEIRERGLTVMADVIRTAAQHVNRPPDEKTVQKQLTNVIEVLSQRYGDDVQILDNPQLARANKAKSCEITYDLYDTILLLEDQEAGPLLRYMFADVK